MPSMERSPSSSSGRNSLSPLSKRVSYLGAKFERVFGGGGGTSDKVSDDESVAGTESDNITLADALEEKRNSISRGREAFKSTGRGGVGNIHASPNVASPDPEDYSPSRGREVEEVEEDRAKSSGRGGVGNIRSRSRARAASIIPEGHPQTASIVLENAATKAAYEKLVIDDATNATFVHSTGRGGAGNISDTRSRSRGPHRLFGGDSPRVHSTGRGGAGNIQPGSPRETDTVDSREDAQLYGPFSEDGIHSTGRGGIANLTDVQSPPPESIPPHAPHEIESSGRGGRGNIRSRSLTRDASNSRSASRDRIARIWQKVTHQPPAGANIQEEAPTTNGVGGQEKPE
ncbi:hypothetical protein PHLCEN_2v5165 [Hermanssonia centrifuga]|uniref:Uncharacterized protein n=1 Tax=Hermanssonia centrifuga TaxID=98765 RepID=A0A2R6P8R0_9APHY|nr:hypothetical protein PHLCEN_2v5165 [Hermanssonia centrifuga]